MTHALTAEQEKNIRDLARALKKKACHEYWTSMTHNELCDLVRGLFDLIHMADISKSIQKNLVLRLFNENLSDFKALSSTWEYLFDILKSRGDNA